MYSEFYGLQENPFSISPNPKYFYLSERHNQAFTHLSYGLKSGGAFVLLTGEVGTGKTTVSRRLLNILPEETNLAIIYHPTDEPKDLYACICDEFKISYEKEASLKDLFDLLKEYFFSHVDEKSTSVIVIDEAQMLSEDSLEQLRLLTNLECDNRKLVQIVLIGQPELQETLTKPSLRQLSQRITARYHINPLDKEDVEAYIRFRLQVAGRIQPLFNNGAIKLIVKHSNGVPRLINLIADRAIAEAEEIKSRLIGEQEVKKAVQFLMPKHTKQLSDNFSKVDGNLPNIYIWIIIFLIMAISVCCGIYSSMIVGPIIKPEIENTIVKEVEEIIDNQDELDAYKSTKNKFKLSVRKASSKIESLDQLYRIWGIDSDGEGCKGAATVKLECYEFLGDFDELVKLNHPAVIRLFDDKLFEFYATLVTVNEQNSTLFIGGDFYEIDTDYLKQLWDNSAVVLWKRLPSGNTKLSNSPSKIDIDYIELSLRRALKQKNMPDLSKPNNMKQKIKEFQQSQGLVDDGLIGAKTLLLLNSLGGTNMPHLTDGDDL